MLDLPHCLIIISIINWVVTLCTRHCAKWFTSPVSFNPLQTLRGIVLSSHIMSLAVEVWGAQLSGLFKDTVY